MKCAIVVPIYKADLNANEVISLLRLKSQFQNDVYFVGPENLSLDKYKSYWDSLNFVPFPAKHFSGIPAYNELMLSSTLYDYFAKDYEWILIHQLDAFLFHDKLDFFMSLDFDYFGAPWLEGQIVSKYTSKPYLLKLIGKKVFVGNGGFSLRRIKSTLDLLKKEKKAIASWKFNEDGFFSYYGAIEGSGFKSCPLEIACLFASEKDARKIFSINGNKLPLGCHAFEKYEIDFYTDELKKLGY